MPRIRDGLGLVAYLVVGIVALAQLITRARLGPWPTSWYLLDDVQNAYVLLGLLCVLGIHESTVSLVTPTLVSSWLGLGEFNGSRLSSATLRVVAILGVTIAVLSTILGVLSAITDILGVASRYTVKVLPYAVAMVGVLASTRMIEGMAGLKSSIIGIHAYHGSVEFLSREGDLKYRSQGAHGCGHPERLLLLTTQEIRGPMRDDSDFLDKAFMDMWFETIASKQVRLEQVILLNGDRDVQDFKYRVHKFACCPNVKLGYIFGPMSVNYMDSFVWTRHFALLGFSNDAAARAVQNFGVKLTGSAVVSAFERLFDQVIVSEARFVKTFEGIDDRALGRLEEELAEWKRASASTEMSRWTSWFEVE